MSGNRPRHVGEARTAPLPVSSKVAVRLHAIPGPPPTAEGPSGLRGAQAAVEQTTTEAAGSSSDVVPPGTNDRRTPATTRSRHSSDGTTDRPGRVASQG